MRIFKVPFDIKREEKIFGGYLSLRQVIYLMLCAISFLVFVTKLNITIKLIFSISSSIFLILCAFLKINEQNFDKFFFYAIKYLFRKKKYVYERCNL